MSSGSCNGCRECAEIRVWVFSDDDFNMESENVTGGSQKLFRFNRPGGWPVAFTSRNRHVVIRSIPGVPKACKSVPEGQKTARDNPEPSPKEKP